MDTSADDVRDVVRILCAMTAVSDMLGDASRRDQAVRIAAELAADARLKPWRRSD